MPSTTGGFRYPNATDPNDVARDIRNLADDVESKVVARTAGKIDTYSEKVAVNAAANGSVTVDVSVAAVHDLTLTGDVTLSLTGAPSGRLASAFVILRQDATGGHTVTFDSVLWPDGAVPNVSTSPDAITTVFLSAVNGLVLGTSGGSDYA